MTKKSQPPTNKGKLIRQKRYRRKQAKIILTKLKKTFPHAFNKKKVVPLKIGIFNDIHAHHDFTLIPTYKIKLALTLWCNRLRYLKGIVYHVYRIDLDGLDCDRVNIGAKRLARTQIKEACILNINKDKNKDEGKL